VIYRSDGLRGGILPTVLGNDGDVSTPWPKSWSMALIACSSVTRSLAITVHERVTDTPANCFGQKVLHEARMARPSDGLLPPSPVEGVSLKRGERLAGEGP